MPPKTKPETEKKADKKKIMAVAALLLLLALAAFVDAQTATTPAPGGGGNIPTAEEATKGYRDFLKQVVLGVRFAIAMAFWSAISIVVAHFAMGKVSPTRFQRVGAFWDGLERAKDIIYGYAWLFLLIFSIFAAIGVVVNGGKMDVDTMMTVVKWIMLDPLTELLNQLRS